MLCCTMLNNYNWVGETIPIEVYLVQTPKREAILTFHHIYLIATYSS